MTRPLTTPVKPDECPNRDQHSSSHLFRDDHPSRNLVILRDGDYDRVAVAKLKTRAVV